MADETPIQVNFGRTMPLFPLEAPVLLPQQVKALHIFEPRYRQLIAKALDGAGQLALAVFLGDRWKQEYHGRPPLRPAVCVAQILQHERLSDGRYNILAQGICRARIVEELPAAEDRLYREAKLEPVGIEADDQPVLFGVRERLIELLGEGPLTKLASVEWVVERIHNEEIPTAIVLELVSFALLPSGEVRYKLLAEGDAGKRATMVERELLDLRRLIGRAMKQHPEAWPKGCSWN